MTKSFKKTQLLFAATVLLAAGAVYAEEAAPPCAKEITGVQTGATGELVGETEVVKKASTGPLKWIGLGAEIIIEYNIGTYEMSNGYTYTVDCGTGKVLSVS